MAEQKHTHDPLNVDEALSTSEAFLLKVQKPVSRYCSSYCCYRMWHIGLQTFYR